MQCDYKLFICCKSLILICFKNKYYICNVLFRWGPWDLWCLVSVYVSCKCLLSWFTHLHILNYRKRIMNVLHEYFITNLQIAYVNNLLKVRLVILLSLFFFLKKFSCLHLKWYSQFPFLEMNGVVWYVHRVARCGLKKTDLEAVQMHISIYLFVK